MKRKLLNRPLIDKEKIRINLILEIDLDKGKKNQIFIKSNHGTIKFLLTNISWTMSY
jgi:hypothetical protein